MNPLIKFIEVNATKQFISLCKDADIDNVKGPNGAFFCLLLINYLFNYLSTTAPNKDKAELLTKLGNTIREYHKKHTIEPSKNNN